MSGTDWLPIILEASAIAGGLIFYVKNWQARDRLRKVRYANMLMNELKAIWDSIKRAESDDYHEEFLEPLPDNVYNGFVSSTNLSYFDKDLQEHLHDLYMNLKDYNKSTFPDENPRAIKNVVLTPIGLLDILSDSVEEAIVLVNEFLQRNRSAKRWRPLLKAIHWYYDD